jgi:Transcription factor WhiB
VNWRDKAACKGKPTSWFFDPEQYLQGGAVCETCPVKGPCRDYADALEREGKIVFGVFGGQLYGAPGGPRDIKGPGRPSAAGLKGTPGRPKEPIEHGTVAGYRKETRHKVKHCDACKAAKALDRAVREAAKR